MVLLTGETVVAVKQTRAVYQFKVTCATFILRSGGAFRFGERGSFSSTARCR